MKFSRLLLIFLSLLLITAAGIRAQGQLTNPYEIMGKSYEALGGLDKFKAERTRYVEGTISVGGLEGSFIQWAQPPLKNRTEVDLTVFKQTSGDNGEFSWGVDANNKVQIAKDKPTLERRELTRLRDLYDYLDPQSKTFTVTFEGIEKIGENDCYVIKTSNNINEDETVEYIDINTFYTVKTIIKNLDFESHTLISDYREVEGRMLPFLQEVETLPLGQKQTIRMKKYEINIDIDPEFFEPPVTDVRDFEFTDGENAEDIPFMFIENHLYIKVNINGKERLWCLDTGAGMTVIDPEYAAELGLTLEGDLKGQGAGQHVDVSFTTLPAYSLEGIRFNEQNVAAIDIRKLFHRWGMDVHGILGYDFLSRFVIKVDYANEKISFYDPDKFEYTGDGVVIDAPIRGNTFIVPATVDNKYSGNWSYDMGAGGLSFHYPYAEKNGLMELDGLPRIASGAGGSFATRLVKFKTIELAGFTITNPLIDFPMEKKGAFGKSEEIGNMGNTLFRHFITYLDYKNQRVIFEKGDDFGKDFPYDKSGMQLVQTENNEIEVLNAPKKTPAGKAGLKPGDIITAINGIDTDYFDGLVALRKLFREDAGTKYNFNILRDSKTKEIKMTLKELF